MTRDRGGARASMERNDLFGDDELLTTSEVGALTRAPDSTVRYWRHLGIGPRGFRIGRRVVYRRAEVLRWLAEQEAADPMRGEPLALASAR